MVTDQPYENQELAQQLLLGEQRALAQVFRVFYKRLLFFAFKVMEDQMGAEDIVQEAFINFWSGIKNKQVVPDNIEGYLFRAVRNLCLNHMKRQRMIDEKNDVITQEFYESIQQRMDELALKEDLFHEIKKRFVHLTPVQAEVMHHLYIDGLSITETAERMNTTAVNIRNHKARALDRLKTVMGEEFLLFALLFLHFI